MPARSQAGGLLVALCVVLAIMFATASWVYADAKTSAGQGVPVSGLLGSLQLNTPVAWFIACLLLGEVVFPLYITSRSSA
ncbi:hypothetical protein [Mycobacterium sp. BK086]|uniref:hypothetical protein n=1 Tax=Mycobacterium sp. BK086 TaxID=2512165 RepID=UPI00105D3E6D|nr:hypothetical protein [Mycobacterium sp. BK086]